MGGPCRIHLDIDHVPDALQALLISEVNRLEQKYSRYRPDSVVSLMNEGKLFDLVDDEETIGLINFAQQCHELSHGVFDLTVGKLREVWDFKQSQLPQPDALARVLQNIGWHKLGWNGRQLFIPSTMEVDLGGLVKEFAADRLVNLMRTEGVDGLVNLAGDIAVTGPRRDESPWRVGVLNPRAPDQAIADIELYAGGMACSGDYERFVVIDDQRYCHILRPDTGYPVADGLASVTVVADQCILAGAISTIAMLKPKTEALSWLNEMELPYLAIDQSLVTYGSVEVKQ